MSLTVDVVFQDYYSKALQKADAKKQKVLLRIIKRLVCILCFANHSLLYLLNAECLAEKQQIPIL
jgi:hypothetical protein